MPHLGIDKAIPGMVLMEDVAHMNGRILMRAGSEITEKNLRVLKTWGILTVNVAQETSGAGHEQGGRPSVSPEQRRAAEARLQDLFRHADLTHPAMAEIYEYRIQRLLDDPERD